MAVLLQSLSQALWATQKHTHYRPAKPKEEAINVRKQRLLMDCFEEREKGRIIRSNVVQAESFHLDDRIWVSFLRNSQQMGATERRSVCIAMVSAPTTWEHSSRPHLGWAAATAENSLLHMGLPKKVFCRRPVTISVDLSKLTAA